MFQQNPWKNHLPDSKKAMNHESSNDIHLDLEMRSGCSFQGGFKTTPYRNPMVIQLWVGYITMQDLCSSLPPKNKQQTPLKNRPDLKRKGSSSNHPIFRCDLFVSGRLIYFDRSSQTWRFHQPRFPWNSGHFPYYSPPLGVNSKSCEVTPNICIVDPFPVATPDSHGPPSDLRTLSSYIFKTGTCPLDLFDKDASSKWETKDTCWKPPP